MLSSRREVYLRMPRRLAYCWSETLTAFQHQQSDKFAATEASVVAVVRRLKCAECSPNLAEFRVLIATPRVSSCLESITKSVASPNSLRSRERRQEKVFDSLRRLRNRCETKAIKPIPPPSTTKALHGSTSPRHTR